MEQLTRPSQMATGHEERDVALWLQITGYYDLEQREAVFAAHQSLIDFEEQADLRLRELDEERARQSAEIEKQRADLLRRMEAANRYSSTPVKRAREAGAENDLPRKVQKLGGEGRRAEITASGDGSSSSVHPNPGGDDTRSGPVGDEHGLFVSPEVNHSAEETIYLGLPDS